MKMRNLYALVCLALILTSMLPILEPAASAKETTETQRTPVPTSTDGSYLSIVMEENVTVQGNGLSQITLYINIPSSPLAEMYRKSLGCPDNASIEQIIPIPETISLVENTNMAFPIREEFYKSMKQQQLEQLGFAINITESSMMPRSNVDEFKVWLKADALLSVVSVSDVGPYDEWKIAVGPKDGKSTTESAFTNVQLIQTMLGSIAGKQVYESVWRTRFEFPDSFQIMNAPELSKLGWKVNFAFDSYMTATVSLKGGSTIVLEERSIMAEGEITATSEYVYDMLGQYRVFQIELFAPHSTSIYAAGHNTTCVDDWKHDFVLASWEKTMSVEFEEGVFSATLTATASFKITGQIAWEFDWHGLKFFETWMRFDATLGLTFHAEASASYSKDGLIPS